MDFNIDATTFAKAFNCLCNACKLADNGLGDFSTLDASSLSLIGVSIDNSDELNNYVNQCGSLFIQMKDTINLLASYDETAANIFSTILSNETDKESVLSALGNRFISSNATSAMAFLKLGEGVLGAGEQFLDGFITIGAMVGLVNDEWAGEFIKKDGVKDWFSNQYSNGIFAWIEENSNFSSTSTEASILSACGTVAGYIAAGVLMPGSGATSLVSASILTGVGGTGRETEQELQRGASFKDASQKGVTEGVKDAIFTATIGSAAKSLPRIVRNLRRASGASDDLLKGVLGASDDITGNIANTGDDVASAVGKIADDTASLPSSKPLIPSEGTKAITTAGDDVASAVGKIADDTASLPPSKPLIPSEGTKAITTAGDDVVSAVGKIADDTASLPSSKPLIPSEGTKAITTAGDDVASAVGKIADDTASLPSSKPLIPSEGSKAITTAGDDVASAVGKIADDTASLPPSKPLIPSEGSQAITTAGDDVASAVGKIADDTASLPPSKPLIPSEGTKAITTAGDDVVSAVGKIADDTASLSKSIKNSSNSIVKRVGNLANKVNNIINSSETPNNRIIKNIADRTNDAIVVATNDDLIDAVSDIYDDI